jgi:hypothetical protein
VGWRSNKLGNILKNWGELMIETVERKLGNKNICRESWPIMGSIMSFF